MSGKSVLSVVRLEGITFDGPGLFAFPGFDQRRSRLYPADRVPTPRPLPDPGAEEVRFYPNPLRGDLLHIYLATTDPAEVDLAAYDLSGRRVATLHASVAGGAGGNYLSWDLKDVAPGVYHVRTRLRGDRSGRESFDKIAIVR